MEHAVGRADSGQHRGRRGLWVGESDRAACSLECVEPDGHAVAIRAGRKAALEVVDDTPDVGHEWPAGERPVVGAEVHVAARVADDGDDDIDQLTIAAPGDRSRVEDPVAARQERVVVEEVVERDRHELPAAAGGGTGPGRRHNTVVLKLVVVGIGDGVVAVVVILEVDLQRVILAGVGVDPEVEVIGARDVDRVGAPEAAVEAGHPAGAPTSFERKGAAVGRGQVGVVGINSATADRPTEREPPVAERVAVLHVVEHHLVEGQRAAGAEGEQVEVDFNHRRVSSHDTGYDDHDLVEVAVEGTVAAGAEIAEAAERRADQRPLIVERRRREGGVEPEGILGAVSPAVAVEVFSNGDLESVAVNRGIALVEDPHVEPGIGRRRDLGGVVEVLERATVEDRCGSFTAPSRAEVVGALIGPIGEHAATPTGVVAPEETPVRGVAILKVVDHHANCVRHGCRGYQWYREQADKGKNSEYEGKWLMYIFKFHDYLHGKFIVVRIFGRVIRLSPPSRRLNTCA